MAACKNHWTEIIKVLGMLVCIQWKVIRCDDQNDLIYPGVAGTAALATPPNGATYQTIDAGYLFSTATVIFDTAKCNTSEVICGTYSPKCVPPPTKTKPCNQISKNATKHVFECHSFCRYISVGTNLTNLNGTYVMNAPMHNFEDTETLETYDNYLKQWEAIQADIFAGVSEFHPIQYSGYFEMLRMTSAGLVEGKGDGQVLMAGTLYRKGRIISFSHDHFPWDFVHFPNKTMNKNMKKWLVPIPPPYGIIRVIYINSEESAKAINWEYLPRTTILAWRIDRKIGIEYVSKVIEHIAHGGALLMGIRPWNYNDYVEVLEHSEIAELITAVGYKFNIGTAKGTWGKDPELIRVDPPQGIVEPLELQILRSTASLEAFRNNTSREKLLLEHAFVIKRYWRWDFTSIVEFMARHYQLLAESLTPCYKNPITSNDAFFLKYNDLIRNQILSETGLKAPGSFLFPGDNDDIETHRVKVIVDINPTATSEYHATGTYLPAGGTLHVKIREGYEHQKEHATNFKITIMGSTYLLGGRKPQYRRWPNVVVDGPWNVDTVEVYSSFGGVVWVKNYKLHNISLEISNVVLTPILDVRQPDTIKNWTTSRNAPGLWADIEGDAIGFTVPSSAIRHLNASDILESLKVYETCVKLGFYTKGLSLSNQQKMMVGTDVQIWMGYMHSGYPIATHLDVVNVIKYPHANIFNPETAKRGIWPLFHEIGHNQQEAPWTYEHTIEVTVNIFTILCHNHTTGAPCFNLSGGWMLGHDIQDRATQYLESGAHYEDLKPAIWVHLTFMMHLQYTFGWEFYRQFFRSYRNTEMAEPTTDLEKRDQWMIRASNITKSNLLPFFEFWGIEVSEASKQHTEHLPAFLPDDVITKLAPIQTKTILDKYPDAFRIPKEVPIIVGPPKKAVLETIHPPRIIFKGFEKIEEELFEF